MNFLPFWRPLLALAALTALQAPVAAADAAAAPKPAASAPSAKQLAALCPDCAWVTGVRSEKRKGSASGAGAVGGAVAGGVVGNKVGDSTAATVGGAVIGGFLGNEIEKRVKRHTVWIIEVTKRDGTSAHFEQDSDPHLARGDTVQIQGNRVVKR